MKAFTLALASILTLMTLASAAEAGHGWTGRTDSWGTTRWSDGHGNGFACSTDSWGTTRCR